MSVAISTQQVESAVLPIKHDAAWELFKKLDLAALSPGRVKETKFTSGGPSEVGAVLSISYVDGAIWTVRVSEISDVEHVVGYQVLTTEPPHQVTSIQGRIELKEVTADGSTFVEWTTNFSNDVNLEVLQDQKYKKLEFFQDFKKTLAK